MTARVVVIVGDVSREDFDRIKAYCINPVESREASMEKPESLDITYKEPEDVAVLEDFNTLDEAGLHAFMDKCGFAMSFEDLKFCQSYFRDTERRAPTITELRVIDTYWSDHCRHTTRSRLPTSSTSLIARTSTAASSARSRSWISRLSA